MKWIKASERLPEHHNEVCVKYKERYCNGNRNYNSGNPKMILFLPSDLITTKDCEWLDESVESDSGEQVRKLREGLEDCDTLLAHLEDYAHGDGGKMITQQRGKIQQLLTETEG